MPPSKGPRTTPITLYVEPEVAEALRQQASVLGRSVAAEGALILKRGLRRLSDPDERRSHAMEGVDELLADAMEGIAASVDGAVRTRRRDVAGEDVDDERGAGVTVVIRAPSVFVVKDSDGAS
jgi:hypothetical protein